MGRRPTGSDGAEVERRKTARFAVSVPLEVSWRGSDGKTIKHEAYAQQANAHGAFLRMESYPEIGTRVTLANFLTAETAEARVLATPNSRAGVSRGIIIELILANESFWGTDLQVKKAAMELHKLEKRLEAEGVEERLLKQFRETVEHLSSMTGAARRLRERQLEARDDSDLLTAIGAERVRQATALCAELLVDLDSGAITAATTGVEQLCSAAEQMLRCLKRGPKSPDHPEAGGSRPRAR